MSFAERARALLAEATAAYRGRPSERRLLAVTRHLDEPLRVAIAGRGITTIDVHAHTAVPAALGIAERSGCRAFSR